MLQNVIPYLPSSNHPHILLPLWYVQNANMIIYLLLLYLKSCHKRRKFGWMSQGKLLHYPSYFYTKTQILFILQVNPFIVPCFLQIGNQSLYMTWKSLHNWTGDLLEGQASLDTSFQDALLTFAFTVEVWMLFGTCVLAQPALHPCLYPLQGGGISLTSVLKCHLLCVVLSPQVKHASVLVLTTWPCSVHCYLLTDTQIQKKKKKKDLR